jgi:hypothetical protein
MLTQERIQVLASKKDVKRIAVENFLSTVGSNADASSAILNMHADATSYKWNKATVNAIRQGIVEYFK